MVAMFMDKKIIVIKSIEDNLSSLAFNKKLSAILRMESEDVFINLYLSVVNCPSTALGEYFLYIIDQDREIYSFPLGARPTNFRSSTEWKSSFAQPLCTAIVIQSQSIPSVIALGREQGCDVDLTTLKKLIAEKCLESRRQAQKSCAKRIDKDLSIDDKIFEQYDDEAVATQNYFELDQKINQKLDFIKEKDNEKFKYQDGVTYHQSFKEEKTEQTCPFNFQDEKGASLRQNQGVNDFFNSKEQDVIKTFRKYPDYPQLKSVFPDSKWVKINYTKTDFYVVGIINEEGKRKYLCYGIPSKYSVSPPKSLEGYCTFIPLSIFDTQGDGFFMMFQDCITGECVLPKPKVSLT